MFLLCLFRKQGEMCTGFIKRSEEQSDDLTQVYSISSSLYNLNIKYPYHYMLHLPSTTKRLLW